MAEAKIDEIGRWTKVKLDILKRYAAEYSKILSSQKTPPFFHVYIDAFAGAGYHLSKTTGEWVLGSPLNALLVQPPFREYHSIDLDGDRIAGLDEVIGQRSDVFLHEGNCNEVLLPDGFPRVRLTISRAGLQARTLPSRPLWPDVGLEGHSGGGKDAVARHLHELSHLRN